MRVIMQVALRHHVQCVRLDRSVLRVRRVRRPVRWARIRVAPVRVNVRHVLMGRPHLARARRAVMRRVPITIVMTMRGRLRHGLITVLRICVRSATVRQGHRIVLRQARIIQAVVRSVVLGHM